MTILLYYNAEVMVHKKMDNSMKLYYKDNHHKQTFDRIQENVCYLTYLDKIIATNIIVFFF